MARRHLKTYFYSCSLNTVLCEAASLRIVCPSRSISYIHVCFLTLFTLATPQTLSPHCLPGQCAHCLNLGLFFSSCWYMKNFVLLPRHSLFFPLLSSIPTPPFFLSPFPPILPLLLHSLETRSHVARACLELCRTEDAIKLLIPLFALPHVGRCFDTGLCPQPLYCTRCPSYAPH